MKNISYFTDKYFTRAKAVLEHEGLNPIVRAQVFLRQGPGVVAGMEEVITLLKEHTPVFCNLSVLRDGETYQSEETILIIEAHIQDIIELETIYLGILSAEITKRNTEYDLDFTDIMHNMEEIVSLVDPRPVSYFGARHWRYDYDPQIAYNAFLGGAANCSTDAGAMSNNGSTGVGTIPHALQNIMAWKYGYRQAVVKSLEAFNDTFDLSVTRVSLIDFSNEEINCAIDSARLLGKDLYGIRIDTCGENVMQGACKCKEDYSLFRVWQNPMELDIPPEDEKYWFGTGVTVSGVYSVKRILAECGYGWVNIMLSSGFGNAEKVKAFLRAEHILNTQLFDSLGVGGIFPAWTATMDIVGVKGTWEEDFQPISKIGRKYKPNDRLVKY